MIFELGLLVGREKVEGMAECWKAMCLKLVKSADSSLLVSFLDRKFRGSGVNSLFTLHMHHCIISYLSYHIIIS